MEARSLVWEEAVGDNSSECSLVHMFVDRTERMVLQEEQHYNRTVNRLEHMMPDS